MKKYKLFSNVVGGEKFWQVGYVINPNEPVHSGNVWKDSKIYYTREEAEAVLAKLTNEGGEV
jgi:hypothetical protein